MLDRQQSLLPARGATLLAGCAGGAQSLPLSALIVSSVYVHNGWNDTRDSIWTRFARRVDTAIGLWAEWRDALNTKPKPAWAAAHKDMNYERASTITGGECAQRTSGLARPFQI